MKHGGKEKNYEVIMFLTKYKAVLVIRRLCVIFPIKKFETIVVLKV